MPETIEIGIYLYGVMLLFSAVGAFTVGRFVGYLVGKCIAGKL